MDNFDEYLRQTEPCKAEKAKTWKAAIGLQQVDGLKPSEFLIQTARQNIEGEIDIHEVIFRIDNYYQQHPNKLDENRTEEADKVSARITEILNEKTFSFSPVEYLNIHKRLFNGIYSHAGKIRDFNISKIEWVLNGETVLYASSDNLKEILEYDFAQEKKFNYKGLSKEEVLEHIVQFISYLWQIHVFAEGNTRTTALFLIKYLRTFGFEVNNELFEKHSWYFRNALVRANFKDYTKQIFATHEFLIYFLENLLWCKNHPLKNRELHVSFNNHHKKSSDKSSDKSSEKIKKLIAANKKITIQELAEKLQLSTRAIEKNIFKLKENGILERIGSANGGYWKIVQ